MSEKNIIDEIKEHNWKESWLDFSFFLYERNRLIIAGSDDLSYYHNLEVIIDNPSYINGVMDWSCDLNEEFIKSSNYTENNCNMSVLEFYSDSELKLKVIAEKISVNFDVVFYYKKENLNIGERLAYWVK
ncbi:hypothetical protein [Citrobacter sedlakii]|uniref:hypothetical protein n=1 Tax=Citrobacter sedlakii TaxID=67826 RepID=UPI0005A97DA8|nr:hypothetical protein [Citrobacter sedlakii]